MDQTYQAGDLKTHLKHTQWSKVKQMHSMWLCTQRPNLWPQNILFNPGNTIGHHLHLINWEPNHCIYLNCWPSTYFSTQYFSTKYFLTKYFSLEHFSNEYFSTKHFSVECFSTEDFSTEYFKMEYFVTELFQNIKKM